MRSRKREGTKQPGGKKEFPGWHWRPGTRAAGSYHTGENWARRQNSGRGAESKSALLDHVQKTIAVYFTDLSECLDETVTGIHEYSAN